ncbi:sister chromatid cohesion protein DCC1 [Momordica charantia]|uniref:Sister chromatid cohesion protein DCC1 n=1 Tax=Momordica charantia TaxID=3673 RepID=A0A6J1CZB2_MOMCH|nr:sister chromatid cohesion protein DCC1 [Momordica charantia]XP_022147139.1 sister chromatid cohesion protein DCC1 [Momordica charantia]XP_022147140.1 sister chromatid cohesion protein DCC1 [Momordica charantia]XP_022147141.1 sister chromatid cohesion protein DCC1 [Momordica charantia]XP_022147142.1 sister chromatid cohesion protein DCC1 [Momordica charantia]
MEQQLPNGSGADAVLHLRTNSSISIAYHSLFGPHDDLVLLEVDEKLLEEVLHQRVSIRGQPEEDAVFCTKSKTYGIKYVGTSNSVLLIPPSGRLEYYENDLDSHGKDSSRKVASVIKVAPGIMELVEIAPRIDKLKLLLSEKPYSLADEWESDEVDKYEKKLYNWDDLINKIQASDDEMKAGLQELSAVEIDGYWRVVDEKYMDSILQMLLHNAVLNDWSLDALNENEVMKVMEVDGFPEKLVRHCLHVYGDKLDEDECKSCLWRLDQKRVCVHFAREVLRKGKMKLESFMDEWTRKIPLGMRAVFDLLEGEVLTERIGVETWVRGFRVSSLPSNPAERFSILFKERPKWEWKDLQPYIRDLTVPGLSSEGLLLKYTRRTQPNPNSEPVFSAR